MSLWKGSQKMVENGTPQARLRVQRHANGHGPNMEKALARRRQKGTRVRKHRDVEIWIIVVLAWTVGLCMLGGGLAFGSANGWTQLVPVMRSVLSALDAIIIGAVITVLAAFMTVGLTRRKEWRRP